MALEEDLSDERGNGDNRVGGGEEMFSADGGAWAFGKVAGEDNEVAASSDSQAARCVEERPVNQAGG